MISVVKLYEFLYLDSHLLALSPEEQYMVCSLLKQAYLPAFPSLGPIISSKMMRTLAGCGWKPSCQFDLILMIDFGGHFPQLG